MRRLLAILLIALMPALALAQWAPNGALPPLANDQTSLLTLTPANGSATVVVPLWQSSDGRLLALVVNSDPHAATAPAQNDLHLVDASTFMSTGLRWNVSKHVYARAGIHQYSGASSVLAGSCADPLESRVGRLQSCLNSGVPAWLGGDVGAGLNVHGFNLDVGVNWLDNALSHQLPQVVSGQLVSPSLLGIPGNFVGSLEGINARGSMRLGDSDTRLSLGASLGRAQLLPGSILGVDAIDKKALSFGVGSGAISGIVVGRIMQPVFGEGATAAGLSGQRWSAIDLGITWRLPWQGELSVGAQNLWSSGAATQSAQHAPLDPAQQRMPYIQYHQEL
ncbi:MAG: hypothetical protein L0H70_03140 [Xanthomonadales bacterium]|nr:hypothetical protein [Xanthomonadales bacterium]